MQSGVLAHIGAKIKFYRKMCGISAYELADLIGKSKATVSKYETGKIAIDVLTLYDIAHVLKIEPVQLMDYKDERVRPGAPQWMPFSQYDVLYLYHMRAHKVFTSVIKLNRDSSDGDIAATLYYKLDDLDDLKKCECLYHGRMSCHETVISFIFENYHNPVENILLNFTIPVKKFSIIEGLMSGLSGKTLTPISYKVLLSGETCKQDDAFIESLTIPKEAYKYMKSYNILCIEPPK